MVYRDQLRNAATKDPEQLLTHWRRERALRIGRSLSIAGIILSLFATIADFFWGATSVFATDFILLLGCLISAHWVRAPKPPEYFWVPLLLSLWLSSLPSFWTTGGVVSPFFGVGLASLYVVGAILDSKSRSFFYASIVLAHIPIFLGLGFVFHQQSLTQQPLLFFAIITTLTLLAIMICVQSILETERALAFAFGDHFRSMAKTKDDLRKREAQLREAQSIARIGSWEWDIQADTITWSDELHKIYGVTREEFNPSFKAYLERLSPESRSRIAPLIQNSIETGADFSFENKLIVDGEDRYLFSRGRVIRNDQYEVVKLLGTCQDITDRKRIESELETAREQLELRVQERTVQLKESLEREKHAKQIAERASQAKMQFLANMSHEIRTPMNSILGFTDLLTTGGHVSTEAQEFLNRIQTNGNHLLHLIDDILDLSKFEAGWIPIQKTKFKLRELVEDVVSSFEPSLKNKGLEMSLVFEDNLVQRIFSDSNRLNQVLLNLLSNAVKFSESGSIRIRVSAPDRGIKTLLRIDIKDSGIGISEEGRKNLFRPFSQGDTSIGRKFGGSGLGLALSRRIAEAMGGTLELMHSEPGLGSHFKLELPVDIVTTNEDAKSQRLVRPNMLTQNSHQGRKILMAEDSPDNAFLIAHFLKDLGLTIDTVPDGHSAINQAQSVQYDCILMDVQMPGMDGLEATRRIRKMGYRGPIVALTAHALPAEAQRSIEAGCDLHLTKPVKKAELIETIVTFFENATSVMPPNEGIQTEVP